VFLPLLYDIDRENDGASELLLDSSSEGYNWFLTAFNAMVKLDPDLRQNVLFVYEEADRLGRRLLREEYPDRLLEAFTLPSSMPLDTMTELMNRVVIEVHNQRTWDDIYSLLVVYRKREGHCNVPRSHVENGTRLGQWVSTQRQPKKEGSLDIERVSRLDELGIFWDVLADKWDNNYHLLLFMKEKVIVMFHRVI